MGGWRITAGASQYLGGHRDGAVTRGRGRLRYVAQPSRLRVPRASPPGVQELTMVNSRQPASPFLPSPFSVQGKTCERNGKIIARTHCAAERQSGLFAGE